MADPASNFTYCSCPGCDGTVNGRRVPKAGGQRKSSSLGFQPWKNENPLTSTLVSEIRTCLVSAILGVEPHMPIVIQETGIAVAPWMKLCGGMMLIEP